MYRATTPTHKFCFGEVNPDQFKEILITYVQNDKIILEKKKQDLVITSNQISGENEEPKTYYHGTLIFTQEEANMFSAAQGSVSIQLRAIDNNGNVLASNKMKASVLDVLNDEVLE